MKFLPWVRLNHLHDLDGRHRGKVLVEFRHQLSVALGLLAEQVVLLLLVAARFCFG